jgi:hypothetical protein
MPGFAPLGPEFQPFLQSNLWEEKNEMRLTMLSALARLDIDPWQEAAELAALPKVWAEERLAERLGRLPGAPAAYLEVDAFCGRSVNLLPQRPRPAVGAPVAPAQTKARLLGLASVYVFIAASIAIVYMLSLSPTALSQRGAAATPAIPTLSPPAVVGAAKP